MATGRHTGRPPHERQKNSLRKRLPAGWLVARRQARPVSPSVDRPAYLVQNLLDVKLAAF
jgi:hypothetical protein